MNSESLEEHGAVVPSRDASFKALRCDMFRLVPMLFFLFLAPARSELSYIEYQIFERQNPEVSAATLNGYLQGIQWANFYIEEQSGARLYCQPKHLEVNIENLRGGMRLHVERDPEQDKAPLGTIVLAALQLIFPCD